jgi:hypothetical protein
MGSAWHESDRPYAIGHRLDRRPYSKSVPTDLGCAPGPRAQAVARHTSKEHARTALEKVIDVHVEIGEAACVRDGRTRGDAEFAVPSFATLTRTVACGTPGHRELPARAASHSNDRRDALVNALFPDERPRMCG